MEQKTNFPQRKLTSFTVNTMDALLQGYVLGV